MWCPDHIRDFVSELPRKNQITRSELDDCQKGYSVKCSCGCDKFKVYVNNPPGMHIICVECGQVIVVYDLNLYTCSSRVSYNNEPKQYISPCNDREFQIYVVYEYSLGSMAIEEDPNDVTWCEVYGYGLNSKKVFLIIDDETA